VPRLVIHRWHIFISEGLLTDTKQIKKIRGYDQIGPHGWTTDVAAVLVRTWIQCAIPINGHESMGIGKMFEGLWKVAL
jgi:hypothetical protein